MTKPCYTVFCACGYGRADCAASSCRSGKVCGKRAVCEVVHTVDSTSLFCSIFIRHWCDGRNLCLSLTAQGLRLHLRLDQTELADFHSALQLGSRILSIDIISNIGLR